MDLTASSLFLPVSSATSTGSIAGLLACAVNSASIISC